MRQSIKITVRDGEKTHIEDAILWIDEIPPSCRRGRNRYMKNRKFKRDKIAQKLEESDAISGVDRGSVSRSGGRRSAAVWEIDGGG